MAERHAEAQRKNAELKAQIQRIQEARNAEQSDIDAVAAEVEVGGLYTFYPVDP